MEPAPPGCAVKAWPLVQRREHPFLAMIRLHSRVFYPTFVVLGRVTARKRAGVRVTAIELGERIGRGEQAPHSSRNHGPFGPGASALGAVLALFRWGFAPYPHPLRGRLVLRINRIEVLALGEKKQVPSPVFLRTLRWDWEGEQESPAQ
jgi:hypothetical protein